MTCIQSAAALLPVMLLLLQQAWDLNIYLCCHVASCMATYILHVSNAFQLQQ